MFLASQDFLESYGEDDLVDETYQENYDKFNETSGNYRTLFQDISDGSGLSLVFTATFGIFQALFDVVKLTFASVEVMDTITTNLVIDFGIPEEIANVIFPLISAIVSILLIFVVVSSINRGNKL